MKNELASERENAMCYFEEAEQELVEFLFIELVYTIEGRYKELKKAWDEIEEAHD